MKDTEEDSYIEKVLDSNEPVITKVCKGFGFLAGMLISTPLMMPCAVIEIVRGNGDMECTDEDGLNAKVMMGCGRVGAEIAGFIPGAVVGHLVGDVMDGKND